MNCSYGTCQAPVKWRFSPDIDIEGLLACDKHLEAVRLAYAALLYGDEDDCYLLLHRKKPDKKQSPNGA